jgi:hypothetical protein
MANHRLSTPLRFSAFPRHQLGWWGLGLTLTFVLGFALKIANLRLPLPSFALFGVGLLGLALNIWAFLLKDRSLVLLVFGGLIGAFIVVWIFGELAFPH